MKAIYLAIMGLAAFYIGYQFYSRFIAEKIFRLDPNFKTPAHEFEDGVDYVPTNKHVLWGHHFTSVAGAAPIVGPAIAVIWGWLPAFLWVVLGTIFFAGVHDFGTLWVSTRHKGQSMGSLTNNIIGERAKTLFLLIIFVLLLMVNAVFAVVIANLFIAFPGSVFPIWAEIPVAVAIGYMVYRKKMPLFWPSLGALALLYVFVALGPSLPFSFPKEGIMGFSPLQLWIILMFVYAFIASSLPVWTLLQPRDYINSHQLFVGLFVVYLGLLVVNPDVVAPAINHNLPKDAPSWLPLLFITIACGAISGFHGLVSSGTTSKQLDKETDARYVGYFGAVGEGTLALASILATTAGFASLDAWSKQYETFAAASNGGVTAFVKGIGTFLAGLGIPPEYGAVFASVLVISFAATTMDTGVRLQRYIISELGQSYNLKFLQNGTIASLVAVITCVLLAFGKDGGKGGLLIWPLFGTTNQLTAGLSLLVITIFLKKLGRPVWYTLVPLVFLLVMTTYGMLINLSQYIAKGNTLLTVMGASILVLELWLILEALAAFRKPPAAPIEPRVHMAD